LNMTPMTAALASGVSSPSARKRPPRSSRIAEQVGEEPGRAVAALGQRRDHEVEVRSTPPSEQLLGTVPGKDQPGPDPDGQKPEVPGGRIEIDPPAGRGVDGQVVKGCHSAHVHSSSGVSSPEQRTDHPEIDKPSSDSSAAAGRRDISHVDPGSLGLRRPERGHFRSP
jgi:hypothetical protein